MQGITFRCRATHGCGKCEAEPQSHAVSLAVCNVAARLHPNHNQTPYLPTSCKHHLIIPMDAACHMALHNCHSTRPFLQTASLYAGRLTQLSWSSNSELLAVVTSTDTQHEEAACARVQIWHRSNWHWYLKQEQLYKGAQTVTVCWDQVASLRLHVVSSMSWYRQVSHLAAVQMHIAYQKLPMILPGMVAFCVIWVPP